MTNDFKFKGSALLQDSVSFGSSFSPDGEVVTLTFNNLNLGLGDIQDETLIKTREVSFVVPVESEQDLAVRLSVNGYMSSNGPTHAALMVTSAGKTVLVDLPKGSSDDSDINQTIISTLPAKTDYKVSLVLLIQRDSDNPEVSVVLNVDEVEVVLENLA